MWRLRPSCARRGSCARSWTVRWSDSTRSTPSGGCGRRERCWWSWTGSRPPSRTGAAWPTPWRPRSARAKAWPWRSRMATAVASPPTRHARTAARRRPRSRRFSSPSTIPGARAPRATASVRCSSTTRRSSCPIPGEAWWAERSTPGPSRATKDAAASCARWRARGASRSMRPGETSRSATGTSCCTARAGASSGCSRSCRGAWLKPEALAVRIAGKDIAQVAGLTAGAIRDWIAGLELSGFQRAVAVHILAELGARLSFVNDVGLGYLTLDRLTRTLSGGEAQRIALSNALGSHLVDTLYVLDEPTIGLHPADTERLLRLLRRLADAGNTVVVVEHDPAAMRAADWMVELGPGSGEAGGQVVYQGPAVGACDAGTLTGQYLSGEKRIGVPSARRPAKRWLTVKGARLHNLHGVDARIPLGTFTAVTGVSGSGKSTLVHDVLFHQLEARFTGAHSAKQHLGEPVGEVRALEGWETLKDVVLVDQAPIGRTPRSNPITYIKGFDELRALFAAEPLARARGYTPSTFSFNVAGGRCEACEGAGHVLVEMVFLANVFVPCEACGGKRFKREVREVKLQGQSKQSIDQVLEWTVDEAIQRLHRHPRLGRALWHLQQVGLG